MNITRRHDRQPTSAGPDPARSRACGLQLARSTLTGNRKIWVSMMGAIIASAGLGACSDGQGPQLLEADIAAPNTIQAVEFGDANVAEPFGATRPAEDLPTIEYSFADGLELPSNDVGYVYRAGNPVSADQVDRLAGYFGVSTADVQPFDQYDAASNATVEGGIDQPQSGVVVGYSETEAFQQWTYTDFNASSAFTDCDPAAGLASASSEPEDPSSVAETVLSDGFEAQPCELPETIDSPPTVEEAQGRLRSMLEQLEVEPLNIEMESFSDVFNTTVNAVEVDQIGLRTGREWSVSYGPGGVIDSASGPLAVPEAVGPFELIDLETAKQRVMDGVNTFGGMGSPSGLDGSIDQDLAAQSQPGQDTAGVGQAVRLVEVRADLVWIWDANRNAWLVPAYAFVDEAGSVWSVPAVMDDLFTAPAGSTATPTSVAQTASPSNPDTSNPDTSNPSTSSQSVTSDPDE